MADAPAVWNHRWLLTPDGLEQRVEVNRRLHTRPRIGWVHITVLSLGIADPRAVEIKQSRQAMHNVRTVVDRHAVLISVPWII